MSTADVYIAIIVTLYAFVGLTTLIGAATLAKTDQFGVGKLVFTALMRVIFAGGMTACGLTILF